MVYVTAAIFRCEITLNLFLVSDAKFAFLVAIFLDLVTCLYGWRSVDAIRLCDAKSEVAIMFWGRNGVCELSLDWIFTSTDGWIELVHTRRDSRDFGNGASAIVAKGVAL